ncbi:MAG: radical SAM protein [Patescibacteria group bacterium]
MGKDYSFSMDDIPTKADFIYKDQIDELTLMCTPLAMNGIHLLSVKSLSVLNQCSGVFSIGEIIQLTGCEKTYVFGVINILWQNRLIRINGEFPPNDNRISLSKQIDVWFHITNNCNLRCPYCYIQKTNESMNKRMAYLAVDNLINSALSHYIPEVRLKFTGGEPLLRFSLIKGLVNYSKRQGEERGVKFSFHILTNGTLLSEKIVRYLKEENITLSLSLDGVEEENNRLRYYANSKGTFRRIEQSMKLLKDYGIRPYILTTVTALNLDGLPAFTRYVIKNKFSVRFSLYRELGVSKEALKNYTDEVIKILHKCYDIYEENLPEEDFSSVHQLCDIKLKKSRKRVCGIGTKGVSIGHRGEIALCQALFNKPIGHISKDDALAAVRNQNQFPSHKYSINNYEHCKDCNWRYLCGGGCPVLTKLQYGRFDTFSPYCEVFRTLIPRLIRIMGLQILRAHRKTMTEIEKQKGGDLDANQ